MSVQEAPREPENAVDYSRYSQEFSWTSKVRRAARDLWNISTFRPNQLEVINAVMLKRDVFVIMPTGGGKSLCFQLPAVLGQGFALVISPLISLIQNQALGLEEVGVYAAAILGSTNKEEVKEIHAAMLAPKIKKDTPGKELKLLYVHTREGLGNRDGTKKKCLYFVSPRSSRASVL